MTSLSPKDKPTLLPCPPLEEKIARAICSANGEPEMRDNGFPEWARYRSDARAAITALTTASPTDDAEIDLEKASYRQLEEAAAQSNWIPREQYFANDWVNDCAHFLRTGEGNTATPGDLIGALQSIRLEVSGALRIMRDSFGHDSSCLQTALGEIDALLTASPITSDAELVEALAEAADNLEYAAQLLDEEGNDAGGGLCQRQCDKFRALLLERGEPK